jgi:F-type H+-transporting ATPase subunit a
MMGVIYFAIGLIEFVSELARVISFTFRLFGNMFAGEVLLAVITFLVPWVLADIFYGLEVFVGAVQALVFAGLTLVFATSATAGHGDNHGQEHGHAAEGHL